MLPYKEDYTITTMEKTQSRYVLKVHKRDPFLQKGFGQGIVIDQKFALISGKTSHQHILGSSYW
jgi:hypothetical protein